MQPERARTYGSGPSAQHLTRRYRLGATTDAVRRTLIRLEHDLERGGGEETLRVRVVLAAAEALNNVVEHGKVHNGAKRISMELVLEVDRARLILTDPGAPACVAADDVEAPMPGGSLLDAPEGGFGLFLIHTLSDRVARNRKRGRNRLELEFT